MSGVPTCCFPVSLCGGSDLLVVVVATDRGVGLLLVVDHLLAAVVLDVWLVGDLGALGGGRSRRLLGQRRLRRAAGGILVTVGALALRRVGVEGALDALAGCEIGRASCRGRVCK